MKEYIAEPMEDVKDSVQIMSDMAKENNEAYRCVFNGVVLDVDRHCDTGSVIDYYNRTLHQRSAAQKKVSDEKEFWESILARRKEVKLFLDEQDMLDRQYRKR